MLRQKMQNKQHNYEEEKQKKEKEVKQKEEEEKNNKVEGLMLYNFKNHYKATVVKIVWYW